MIALNLKSKKIICRMKYEGKNLVENYGVKVDTKLHQEVLDRADALNIQPYNGFVNPILTAAYDDNNQITDIKITQPASFAEQMLNYSSKYGYLNY